MSQLEIKHGEGTQSKRVTIKLESGYPARAKNREDQHGNSLNGAANSSDMKPKKWTLMNNGRNGEESNHPQSDQLNLHERNGEINGYEIGNTLPRIAVAHTGTGKLSGGYSEAGTRNLAILTDAQYYGISPDISNKATELFLASANRENTIMQDLNDRLIAYMARIQEYEKENQNVHNKWKAVTKAHFTADKNNYAQYTDQLTSLRTSIDKAIAAKAEIEAQKLVLENYLKNYRFRLENIENNDPELDKYKAMLVESRNEANELQARFKQLSADVVKANEDNNAGWDDVRGKDEEWRKVMVDSITFENQCYARMEELLTYLHDEQDRMVIKLDKTVQAEQQQPSADVRNNLAQAIRDIKVEYNMISEQARHETDKWYELKFSKARETVERKRNDRKCPHAKAEQLKKEIENISKEIAMVEGDVNELEMRARTRKEDFTKLKLAHEEELFEHESNMRRMLQERQRVAVALQSILDTIQVHDAEIAIYRTMLEGEEKRIGVPNTDDYANNDKRSDLVRQNTTPVSAMAYYKTTAKNARIKFCHLLGKYIVLENISSPSQDLNIGGWQIHREVDNQPSINYTLPDNVVLKASECIEIHAMGHDSEIKGENALVAKGIETWGAGTNIITTLRDELGESIANHTQKPEKSTWPSA